MVRNIGMATAALLLLTAAAFGQDVNRLDVNLGITGIFPKQAEGNGTVQTSTKSGAFLATVRWRFNPKHSVEFNYAHGSDSQIYTNAFSFRIQSHITELTGAYAYTPFETSKIEPFVFAGAGVLEFNPFNTFVQTVQVAVPSVKQTQPAFLYGGGLDFKIFSDVPLIRRSPAASHLAFRLQYRGLFYKTPDFKNPDLFTASRGHMAEGALGIVIKF